VSIRDDSRGTPQSVTDTRYVKLDQTTPQTMTGLTDGVLQLINGVIATRIANQTFTYFT
jgi:hypothetical protein